MGSPQRVHQIQLGVSKIGDFRPIRRYIAETMQDSDMVTVRISLAASKHLYFDVNWP